MNRDQHLIFGTLSFVPYIVLFFWINGTDIQIISLSYLGLLTGSIIPDLIEPATDWKHRGFYHSKRILKQLTKIFLLFSLISVLFQILLIISSFLLGYVIHLLADSTTKVGLMD